MSMHMFSLISKNVHIRQVFQEFPGSLVVGILGFQCPWTKFNPWWENWDPTSCMTWPKKEKIYEFFLKLISKTNIFLIVMPIDICYYHCMCLGLQGQNNRSWWLPVGWLAYYHMYLNYSDYFGMWWIPLKDMDFSSHVLLLLKIINDWKQYSLWK